MKFEYAGMPPDSSAPELAHARIARVTHDRFLGLGPTSPSRDRSSPGVPAYPAAATWGSVT